MNLGVKIDTKNKSETKSRYKYYVIALILLCIIGLVDSLLIAITHYRVYTDPFYSSFCAISESINCDTVSQSNRSIFYGIPVAYWGIFGYLVFLLLTSPLVSKKENRHKYWSLLLGLAAFYSCISIYLGYVSAVYIKSFCLLCLVSYGINFSLFFMTWLARNRFASDQSFLKDFYTSITGIIETRKYVIVLVSLVLIFVSVKFFIPQYWEYHFTLSNNENIKNGITDDGHPWIGSPDGILIIEEYSDYQCFQCAKMHYMIRQLISEYPDRIKLIHHHYPLDHEYNPTVVPKPFHVGSGKMSLMAIHAMYEDKFWEVNDILFEYGKRGTSFSTKSLAEKTGFTSGELVAALKYSEYIKRLNYDIKKGMKLRITDTPTFIIDGEKYVGTIPPSVLKILKK